MLCPSLLPVTPLMPLPASHTTFTKEQATCNHKSKWVAVKLPGTLKRKNMLALEGRGLCGQLKAAFAPFHVPPTCPTHLWFVGAGVK